MKLGTRARVCALLLVCVSAACSSAGDVQEAASEVAAQVGKSGGRLELSGVTLEIPEGALDKDERISVRNKGSSDRPPHSKALSDVYEFGPAGLKFKKDVEVRFEVLKEERGAVVFFTKEDQPREFEALETVRKDRDYVAKVKHFSAGFVGIDTAEDAGTPDEAGGLDGASEAQPDAELDESDTGSAEAEEAGAPNDAGTVMDASRSNDAGTLSPDAATGAADASQASHIVIQSRDDVGAPANYTWAAFQDGTGPWQRLSPAGSAPGRYEFDVNSARYGVAFVCADPQQLESQGIVRYAAATTTSMDIRLTLTAACRVGTPQTMHTVYGPLTRAAGDSYYRYGHANISQLNSSMGATTLFASAFPGGVLSDLVAGVGSSVDSGLSRVMIVRDLLINADLQRPFDFVAQGSNVGPSYSVLVSDASDQASLDVYYTTRHELGGMPMRQGPTSTPAVGSRLLVFASIPASLQRPDDAYLIRARETVGTFSRLLELRTNLAENQNLALPAHFPASFTVEPTPYLRPGIDFSDYPAASQYSLVFGHFPAGEQHRFELLVDADWLSGVGPRALTFPDLSAAQGFDTRWVPPSDTTETLNMGADALVHSSNAQRELSTSAGNTGSYRVSP